MIENNISIPGNNNLNGCFSLIFWLIGIFLVVCFAISYLTSSQSLWVWNHSGKTILIKNCYLNGTLLDECDGNLLNKRAAEMDTSDLLYHFKQNHFEINIVIDHKNYAYTCDFYRKKTDCQEETAISDKGLSCEKYCSSVYN